MANNTYFILDTQHPLYPSVVKWLKELRYTAVPVPNVEGDKSMVQLKEGEQIPSWVVNNITTRDGVYWAGPLEYLYKQTSVDLSEWDDGEDAVAKREAENDRLE